MRAIRFKQVRQHAQYVLSGTHMLAFLPALCLAAFWGGGEMLLVVFALLTPLLYAAIGGFGQKPASNHDLADDVLCPVSVSQDFLEIARHNGQTTACFQIGITGFDEISRRLGDEFARDARNVVKGRLESALRSGDHVFQTGENRFVVFLVPGFRPKLDGLLDLSKRLRTAVEEPVSLAGTTQFLFAAIGISSSLNFARNTTAEIWIASANQALGEAAANGPSATRVWSDKLSQNHQARRALREDLANALANGEIQAYFQPQVSVRTGAVVGMEALARWEHPKRGCIEPAEFLRALHDSGEMEVLGKTMLAQSLAALRRWDDAGLQVDTVSVNFSDIELRNPNLPDHIKWELDRLELPGHRLAIEVLESVVSNADDMIHRNLTKLAAFGCRIDLDDFGTGNASVAALQHLPVKRIKIDQNLIKNVDAHSDKKRMLRAVLSMSECLRLETLAEGVETVGEQGTLRECGCQFAQGFLFAKPMPVSVCDDWLRQNQHPDTTALPNNIRRLQ
jgi:EAL domain-containing protein (putative c-di-GMP-specific phosphodiesterase class I)